MKIDPKFKIDLARDKSCTEGGVRHTERKLHDNFGRHIGYECTDCGHKTIIRRRQKKIQQKGLLLR